MGRTMIGRIHTIPTAKITKMKDGRTHLAHKAQHAIDLETGGIVGVTVQDADDGDTATLQQMLPEAADQLEAVAAVTDDSVAVIEEVVADKGYHIRSPVAGCLGRERFAFCLPPHLAEGYRCFGRNAPIVAPDRDRVGSRQRPHDPR